MQRCLKCKRTYPDETQKFCTFDGGRLVVDSEAPTNYDLSQTIRTDVPPENLGATILGSAPDLTRTVAGPPPPTTPSTSEIHPPALTAPTYPPRPEPWPASPSPGDGSGNVPTAPTINAVPTMQPVPPSETQTTTGPQTSPLNPPAPSVAQPVQTPSQPPPPRTPTLSASLSSLPVPPAPAAPAVAQPGKSSRLPWIIAGAAVVLLLAVVGVAALFLMIGKNENKSGQGLGIGTPGDTGKSTTSNQSTATNSNANESANSNSAPATAVAPPNSTRFVNSSASLDGKLAENYVDFSFFYPNTWQRDPKSGVKGAANFVKVERGIPPFEFTQENFSVGYYESGGTYQKDRANFPELAEKLSARLAKSFPQYQKVSEGEMKVGAYEGYEFRFQAISRNTEKGDIRLWGRVVFIPAGTEGKHGVALLMLTTSLAPELKGVEDVGLKGELPVILNSFRLGQ